MAEVVLLRVYPIQDDRPRESEGWLFLRRKATFKKAAALTLSQARLLIMAVLPCAMITPTHVIEIVDYHRKRNYIAYRSHRKKKLMMLVSNKSPL